LPPHAFEVPCEELADGVDLIVVPAVGKRGKLDAQVLEPWRLLR